MSVNLSGTPAPASTTGLGAMKSEGKDGGAEVEDMKGLIFSRNAAREAALVSDADAAAAPDDEPAAASAAAAEVVLRARRLAAMAARATLRMAVARW